MGREEKQEGEQSESEDASEQNAEGDSLEEDLAGQELERLAAGASNEMKIVKWFREVLENEEALPDSLIKKWDERVVPAEEEFAEAVEKGVEDQPVDEGASPRAYLESIYGKMGRYIIKHQAEIQNMPADIRGLITGTKPPACVSIGCLVLVILMIYGGIKSCIYSSVQVEGDTAKMKCLSKALKRLEADLAIERPNINTVQVVQPEVLMKGLLDAYEPPNAETSWEGKVNISVDELLTRLENLAGNSDLVRTGVSSAGEYAVWAGEPINRVLLERDARPTPGTARR